MFEKRLMCVTCVLCIAKSFFFVKLSQRVHGFADLVCVSAVGKILCVR